MYKGKEGWLREYPVFNGVTMVFYKDKDRMEVNSNSFFIYMQQQSLSLLSIDF